ncbi:MAG: hypothetical protein ABIP13_03560 [Tepidiformaceae bacterium]
MRGDVEVLAAPGDFALVQGDEGIGSGLGTGMEGSLRVAHGHGRTIFVTLKAEKAP